VEPTGDFWWSSAEARRLDHEVNVAGQALAETLRQAAGRPDGRELIRAALARVDSALDAYYEYRRGGGRP
jgi:hypothetical protein